MLRVCWCVCWGVYMSVVSLVAQPCVTCVLVCMLGCACWGVYMCVVSLVAQPCVTCVLVCMGVCVGGCICVWLV